jgi:hypothetical protein
MSRSTPLSSSSNRASSFGSAHTPSFRRTPTTPVTPNSANSSTYFEALSGGPSGASSSPSPSALIGSRMFRPIAKPPTSLLFSPTPHSLATAAPTASPLAADGSSGLSLIKGKRTREELSTPPRSSQAETFLATPSPPKAGARETARASLAESARNDDEENADGEQDEGDELDHEPEESSIAGSQSQQAAAVLLAVASGQNITGVRLEPVTEPAGASETLVWRKNNKRMFDFKVPESRKNKLTRRTSMSNVHSVAVAEPLTGPQTNGAINHTPHASPSSFSDVNPNAGRASLRSY